MTKRKPTPKPITAYTAVMSDTTDKTTPRPWPKPEFREEPTAYDEVICEFWEIDGVGSFDREADAQLAHKAVNRDPLFDELVASLDEILNYEGGADSALEDEYVMERASAVLSRVKQAREGV